MSGESTIGFLWGATVGGGPGYIGGGAGDAALGVVPSLTFPVIGDLLAGTLSPDVQAGVLGILNYHFTGQGNPFNAEQLEAAMAESGTPLGGADLYYVAFCDQTLLSPSVIIGQWSYFYTSNPSAFETNGPWLPAYLEDGSVGGRYLDWFIGYVAPVSSIEEDQPYYPNATPESLLDLSSPPTPAAIGGLVGADGQVAILQPGAEAGVAGDHGTFTLGSEGNLTYAISNPESLPLGLHPVDSVTLDHIQIDFDGPATVDIVINRYPVLGNDVIAAGARGVISASSIVSNDTDDDGDTLTITAVNGDVVNVGVATVGGLWGSLLLEANGDFVYTPASYVNAGSEEVFAYTVSDGYGGEVEGTLTFTFARTVIMSSGTITGTVGGDEILGSVSADTINAQGGNDLLLGEGENDTLNGGGGNDQMEGGAGNDTYVVNAAGDTVVEAAGAGTDQVKSSVSWALAANIENLVLTGTALINGTGNALANKLTGNASSNVLTGGNGIDILIGNGGHDTLIGEAGKDRLTGSLGDDAFQFASAAHGGDMVTDFHNAAGDNDLFRISAAGFGAGLAAGSTLAASRFQTRTDNLARDADDRFIFRTTDATLWFDSNGSVSGGLTMIADLQAGASVTSADILLV